MTLLELIMTVLQRVLLKLHGSFSHIHVSIDLINADVTIHDVTGYDVTWWLPFHSGQWGLPQFVASAIIGMISGALASIIESIGGYFAAARMVAAPPVPSDGVNRGILMEGVACLWAGLIGSGCGVTSYSGNIGALAITRNGSPRIMYAATLVLCIFGKLIANFSNFQVHF